MLDEHLLNVVLEVEANVFLVFRRELFEGDWLSVFDDDFAFMNPWEVILENVVCTCNCDWHDFASCLLSDFETSIFERKNACGINLVTVTSAFWEDENGDAFIHLINSALDDLHTLLLIITI